MLGDDTREPLREPRHDEEPCDCEDGLRHWQQDVREGVEVCADCRGSGVVAAPVCSQETADYMNALARGRVVSVVDALLAPYRPKENVS